METKPKVYDLFTFFNELDLLEIRLNILDQYVDYFILAEAPTTFSGQPKPLYYAEHTERFAKWNHKIIHLVIDDFPNDPEITAMMDAREYVPKDKDHYRRAFYQKESLRKGLVQAGAKDDDIVYYGDLDEIWKPKELHDDETYKLRQLCYSYYLNNRSSEDWRGTIVTRYKNVKHGCLNDLRANPKHILDDGGWHFTNMGGPEAVKAKIEAYDHQEFNTPEIKAKIEKQMQNNKDFLGRFFDFKWRRFKFWTDEGELPAYVREHKAEYPHLFK
jgi:beta-1,4-mannosyl-glycoprotein beta-1,4-N-acetylglucosaminyltransferase